MSHIKITIKASVGRASRGCAGFSVCSITIGVDPSETLEYDNEAGLMVLTLSKAVIQKEQPDKLPYFEGQDIVTFEEAFTLPKDVQDALKSDKPLTIPTSTCPLVIQGDSYIINDIHVV